MQAPGEQKEEFMEWLCLIVFVVAIGMQSNSVFAQDRMPAMPLEKMTDLQKKYAAEIVKVPAALFMGRLCR